MSTAEEAQLIASLIRRVTALERAVAAGDATKVAKAGDTMTGDLTILSKLAAVVESATYTPTLTNMVIGAGGTNNAAYVFVGGPSVGNYGLINLRGEVVLGAQSSVGTGPTLSLPSGFQFLTDSVYIPIGAVRFNDSSTPANNRFGVARAASSVSAFGFSWGGSSTQIDGVSSTLPFTWAAGDSIYYALQGAPVVRV